MPLLTPRAASVLALLSLAACAGPMKTKVPDGLAYDCGEAGKAYIRFGGGGYLPGETAMGKDDRWDPKEQAGPRMRSTAKLTLGETSHDLIAEWTQGGLRYRSAAPIRGNEYLIWSLAPDESAGTAPWRQSGGRPLTPEDALLGLRASADPVSEPDAIGRFHATCRRVGRDAAPGTAAAGHQEAHGSGHQRPKVEADKPHTP